ncbi:hypothetical protein V2J09_006751, partial [Rumex salicifolius]
ALLLKQLSVPSSHSVISLPSIVGNSQLSSILEGGIKSYELWLYQFARLVTFLRQNSSSSSHNLVEKMEIKEVQKVAIAKPIASKPSFSNFRSFSELLAGAINASPSPANVCKETTMAAAIRPKTVRVKPILNRASIASPSSKVEGPETKSYVVYKPLAKLVSKATISLLASMENPDISTHQQVLAQVEARAQYLNQSKLHVTNNIPMTCQALNIAPSQAKKVKTMVEEEPKPYTTVASIDRPSYDGYNWRKYGQKQVKGSEYPRSYYKCTHPKCPVKKKVERSFDGEIAEIVYKGEHSHPKPIPPKKSSSQDTKNPKSSNIVSEPNEGSEGNIEDDGEVLVVFPTKSTLVKKQRQLSHKHCCEEGGKGLEVDEDEPRSKRRKSRNQGNESGKSGEVVIQEPGISVQNANEISVLGDGFRWRKYGQKVVKGNPFPRSYYKCTSLKCNVRKHVERTSDDPKAYITTYEGKHNHDMPLRIANSAASR